MESREKMAVEGEERGETVLERVMRQREQHQQRSIFVRAGVVVAGGAVGVFAVPLSLPSPELGLPLLLFGLRLLALEFDWAAHLYARVYVRAEKLARKGLGAFKRLLGSKRGIALVVVSAIVMAVGVAVSVRMLVS